jgi:aminoglycoside 6'-N-acetyltransferase
MFASVRTGMSAALSTLEGSGRVASRTAARESRIVSAVTVLQGLTVTLRPATPADVAALVTIRATPEVRQRWSGAEDVTAEILDELVAPDLHLLVIDQANRIVGAIQWQASEDPVYRHAGIDLYLDPAVHGRGLGTDAVRTLARHLIHDHRHHRLVVDPAADNAAAIRCYTKVGFRPVGIMRQYERGPDGTWHDGLLMDLLAGELIG